MDRDDDFAEFVSATWTRLYRMAYLLAAEDQAAADLLRTAMEKTYARWPEVSRMDHPEAYGRKVVAQAAIHRWPLLGRSRQRLHRAAPACASLSEDTGFVDHALMWRSVCALPPRERAVVVLRYYEDLTAAETADVLGCPVGTVESWAYDALVSLGHGLGAVALGEVLER
jgi:RNA polymerase sigma-70 factor (sigma-E family)